MKIIAFVFFVSVCLTGFSQSIEAIDSYEGLGMFKFGSSREHCECTDNGAPIENCYNVPKNLFSYGYQVSKVSFEFSEKTDQLAVVNVHFAGATAIQRNYILDSMKDKYGKVSSTEGENYSWIGLKNTIQLSKKDEIIISYIQSIEE